MRIQHNITAMNAYRNYNANTNAVAKNLEKLSSGYRINRAGDDAAGLAISEKMRAQISGLTAAQKNVKDGLSLVKTAEGATQEIHDMLNRMVTLAEQSANGTYQDAVDREAIVNEFNALKTEINRIADSSNFNGIKLLDGSLDNTPKIVDVKDATSGENAALTVLADGQLGREAQAGVFQLDLTNFTGSATADSVKVTIFGQEITVDAKTGGTVTGTDIAKAIVEQWADGDTPPSDAFSADDSYGVKLTASSDGAVVTFTMDKAPVKAWNEDVALTWDDSLTATKVDTKVVNQAEGIGVSVVTEPVDNTQGRLYAQAELDLTKLDIKDGTTLTIGDSTYTFAVGKNSAYKGGTNVVDLTDMDEVKSDDMPGLGKVASRITTAALSNKNFKVTANSATDDAADGKIYLTEKEGGVDTKNYKLEGKDNATDAADGDWTGLVKVGKLDAKNTGTGLVLQIGEDSASYNQLTVSVSDMHTKALGLDSLNLGTQAGAQKAISAINDAINSVSQTRGRLGATQNRLEHTSNNLSVMKENIQDAESAIRDTDIAEEMMAYTKNSILVQSAQAMLAQANQIPQGVLQLLG